MGNREVPRIEANLEREGGTWGKPGFPHATEAKPKEAV